MTSHPLHMLLSLTERIRCGAESVPQTSRKEVLRLTIFWCLICTFHREEADVVISTESSQKVLWGCQNASHCDKWKGFIFFPSAESHSYDIPLPTSVSFQESLISWCKQNRPNISRWLFYPTPNTVSSTHTHAGSGSNFLLVCLVCYLK